jgi:SAM-dependent methyltransferase
MNRRKFFQRGISKTDFVLEIGPYVNPLFPKCEGWNVISNDVFSYDELITKAKGDDNLDDEAIARIESVDHVGEPTRIFNSSSELDEKVDYVISSHNLEHIPNPLKFLNTCEKVLKNEGLLILALPDYRCCWDRFRPLTCCGDWLQAYYEDRSKPTAKQIFVQNSMHCRWNDNGTLRPTMPLATNTKELVPLETLGNAYEQFVANFKKGASLEYVDTHCWTFTPDSFSLILLDLFFLKLTKLSIREIESRNGSEFLVKLEKSESKGMEQKEFFRQRKKLFYRIASFYSDQL